MHRRSIVIVTPALADANNGNWQTARRWAGMLQPAYRTRLTSQWPDGGPQPAADALMIALHARRSAASIQAWRQRMGAAPLLLVLTGTDLYRDIHTDAAAQRSLQLADALVVLNALGPRQLPAALQPRCHVVLQSSPQRGTHLKDLKATQPLKHLRQLRVLMVGHLRPEKDPLTFLRAAARLAPHADLRFEHIGGLLDPALAAPLQALAAPLANFRGRGALPHAQTLRRIQAAHLLVQASLMEGGAHTVIEALRSGTPVLASRIDGNLGLLGEDWPATFEPGDDAALAALIAELRARPDKLADLQQRARHRAALFDPAVERSALLRIVQSLMPPDAPDGP